MHDDGKEEKELKEQVKQEALKHPLKKELAAGPNSFVDFLLLGFYQEKKDASAENQIHDSLLDFIAKKRSFAPMFLAAALLATFGVTESFGKKKKELRRNKLKIIETEEEKLWNIDNLHGQFRLKFGIFIAKTIDGDLNAFVHELSHLLDYLLNDHSAPYPSNNPMLEQQWIENAEAFNDEIISLPDTPKDNDLAQFFYYGEYHESEWADELKARMLQFQYLNTVSDLPIKNDSVYEFLKQQQDLFFSKTYQWIQSFIEEAGLNLISGFTRNFWLARTTEFSEEDMSLINEAKEKNLLVIDVFIQKAIKAGANSKTIYDQLIQNDITPYSIMQSAVRLSNLDLLKHVHQNFTVDPNDKRAINALHYAARSSNVGMLKYLISEMRINLFSEDSFRRNILFWQDYFTDEMKAFIDKSVTENHLFKAIENKEYDNFQTLLKKIDINLVHPTYGSVLLYAMRNSNFDIIHSILTAKKIDINVNLNYTNALFELLDNENLSYEETKQLFAEALQKGIQLDTTNIDGENIVHQIVKAKQLAAEQKLELIKMIQDKHGKLNLSDNNGCLPIHYACRKDANLILVEYLLQNNSEDVNQQDEDGRTPLHIAAEQNNEEIIKLLLQRPDLDLTKKDSNDKTAFDYLPKEEVEKYKTIWNYAGGKKTDSSLFFKKTTEEKAANDEPKPLTQPSGKKFGG